MSGSRSLHARGFTLIELLVVVAAVAVLIALLLPSMAKAREHAKQVICTGNLRQNAVAMSAYLHDSNDWLPTIWSSAWDGPPVAIEGGYAYNQGLLYPYLNDNAATLFCPDVVSGMSTTWKMFTDPRGGAKTFAANWKTKVTKTYTSYGMPRRWDDLDNMPAPPLPWWSIYNVYREQNDINCYVAIKNSYNSPPLSKGGRWYPTMACLQQWGIGGIAIYGAHNGLRSNFVYSDGGVKTMDYNFRASGASLFASSALWAIFTTIR